MNSPSVGIPAETAAVPALLCSLRIRTRQPVRGTRLYSLSNWKEGEGKAWSQLVGNVHRVAVPWCWDMYTALTSSHLPRIACLWAGLTVFTIFYVMLKSNLKKPAL